MWRCGARKPKRVTSCADSSPCAEYAVDERHLAWLQGARRVIAMDVRTSTRTRLVAPKTEGKITAVVLGTNNYLYVADAQGTIAVTKLPSTHRTRSAAALDQT